MIMYLLTDWLQVLYGREEDRYIYMTIFYPLALSILILFSLSFAESLLIIQARTNFDVKQDSELEEVLIDNTEKYKDQLTKAIGKDYKEIIYRCLPVRTRPRPIGVMQQVYWYASGSTTRKIIWSRLYPSDDLPARVKIEVMDGEKSLFERTQLPGTPWSFIASLDLKAGQIYEQAEPGKFRVTAIDITKSESVFTEDFQGKFKDSDPRYLVNHHNKVFHIIGASLYGNDKEILSIGSLPNITNKSRLHQLVLFPNHYRIAYSVIDENNSCFLKVYDWTVGKTIYEIRFDRESFIEYISNEGTLFYREKAGKFNYLSLDGQFKGSITPYGKALSGCGLINDSLLCSLVTGD